MIAAASYSGPAGTAGRPGRARAGRWGPGRWRPGPGRPRWGCRRCRWWGLAAAPPRVSFVGQAAPERRPVGRMERARGRWYARGAVSTSILPVRHRHTCRWEARGGAFAAKSHPSVAPDTRPAPSGPLSCLPGSGGGPGERRPPAARRVPGTRRARRAPTQGSRRMRGFSRAVTRTTVAAVLGVTDQVELMVMGPAEAGFAPNINVTATTLAQLPAVPWSPWRPRASSRSPSRPPPTTARTRSPTRCSPRSRRSEARRRGAASTGGGHGRTDPVARVQGDRVGGGRSGAAGQMAATRAARATSRSS